MKKSKAFTAAALCAAVFSACSHSLATVDFNNAPDTERCQYMKEVCKEAQAFQGRYESMSPEEKKEAKAVLNAYTQQCEDAAMLCRMSLE